MRVASLTREWWEKHEWLAPPERSESARFCASLCPIATIAVATGLWCGCALAGVDFGIGLTDARACVLGSEAIRAGASVWILPLNYAALVVLIGAFVLVIVGSVESRRRRLLVGATLLAIAAALFGASLRAREIVSNCRAPPSMATTETALVRIEGTLLDVPQHRLTGSDALSHFYGERDRWTSRIDSLTSVADDGACVDVDGVCSVVMSSSAPLWKPGERYSFLGRLRMRVPPANEAECLASPPRSLHHAWGSMSIEHSDLVKPAVTSDRAPSWLRKLMAWRSIARARLRESVLSGMPAGDGDHVRAMLVTLLLGGEEDGSRAVEQRYQVVGLSHILAVSGFNLVVLGAIAGWIARVCFRSTRTQLIVVLIVMLAALCLLAPTASAMRAASMSVIGVAGGLARRDWNSGAILAAAAILALVAAPSTALDPGFQLSFAAVLGLRFLATPLRARIFPALDTQPTHILRFTVLLIATALATSLAATLATIPIVIIRFGTVAPYAVFETLVCTPLATVIMVIGYPKAMLGSLLPVLSAPLGLPLYWLGSLQNALVELSLQLPHLGARTLSPIQHLGLLLCLIWAAAWTIALWFACRGTLRFQRRCAVIMLLLCTAVPVAPVCFPKMPPWFELRVLSIGDGTTMVIRSGDATALFDGGSLSTWSVAQRILVPELRLLNAGRVDAAFVSHPNLDHFSALLDVALYVGIGHLYVTEQFMVAAAHEGEAPHALINGVRATGTEVVVLRAGDSVRVGNSLWNILAPDHGFFARNANDSSFVIRIDVDACEHGVAPTRSVLLMGDLETEGIARVLKSPAPNVIATAPNSLKADVFEIPHHGSWRPIVPSLVDAVDPLVVLQSTASRRFANDRYAPAMLDRSRGVTCRDGAMRVLIDARGTLELHTFDRTACMWITRRIDRRAETSRARTGRSSRQSRAPPREARYEYSPYRAAHAANACSLLRRE